MTPINTIAHPTDSLTSKTEALLFIKKLAGFRPTNVNPNRFTVPDHTLEGSYDARASVLCLQFIREGAVYSLSVYVPPVSVPRLLGAELAAALAKMFFARATATRSFRFSVIAEEISTRVVCLYRGDDEAEAMAAFSTATDTHDVLSVTKRDRETGVLRIWDLAFGFRTVAAPARASLTS